MNYLKDIKFVKFKTYYKQKEMLTAYTGNENIPFNITTFSGSYVFISLQVPVILFNSGIRPSISFNLRLPVFI